MAIGNVKIAKMSTFHDGELRSLTAPNLFPNVEGTKEATSLGFWL
jgi:hypothetical protein